MRRALYAVLLLAFVLALWNVWAYDLWAPDEPFFGDGAREMVADGQWLVPHVNGVVNPHKPPLFFWLIALFSLPFGGVSSLTARLPSILAGVGSVWLTARLGRRLAGERAGVFAGLVMATAYLPWDKARSAQIDAVLCFLVLVALSAFEAFRAGDLDGRRAGLVFWIAGGLATLAKGPVGFLIPLGVALVTLALDRDLRAFRRFAPVLGPLACIVTIGLWAGPAMLWGTGYSLWGALKTHFFGRALHGMHHKNPPWYYLGAIPLQFLPWSVLLPGALWSAWQRRRTSGADRFLLAWIGFVVVFFSLSGERRDLYVLPAYPALALLVARLGAEIAGWSTAPTGAPRANPRWVTFGLGALALLFAMLAIGVPIAAARQPAPLSTTLAFSAKALAAVLALGVVALIVSLARRRTGNALLATAATMSLLYIVVAALVLPLLNPMKSARPFAERMATLTLSYREHGGRVVSYRLGNVPEAISFFTGIYTPEWEDPQQLAAHLAAAPSFAIANERDLDALPPDVRARLDVLARADLSRMDVVLVASRSK